ncbi:MAG TPA: choice-of-anchor P family protein, partial [Candidatus Angelobacter sp.]
MSNGPRSPSSYFHHASAFGIAGKIDRPLQQTIASQAAISLAPSGGYGTHRVDNFSAPGVLSFKAAYVEVGGSLDTANDATHTTYASSVIEELNICNVVTADRVVSRLTIYHPATPPASSSDPSEPSFSIAGSHFDNLKIAGQNIAVQLDYDTFHDSTYSTFVAGLRAPDVPKRHVL